MSRQEYSRMHSYPSGSEVQRTTGHVYKKMADGKWVSRGRWTAAAKKIKGCESGEIEPNQRVFHVDGDPANDDPANLAAITFTGTVYRLKRSRPVWIPPIKIQSKPFIPKYQETKEKEIAKAR